MALTNYLEVIPLAKAQVYLRIDDSQNETDAEITSMIKSALRYIEKQTNHIMYERAFVYDIDQEEKKINVYDYPIQSVTAPASADNYERTDKTLYSQFELAATTLTLQVGYALLTDIPEELIDAALIYIAALYYAHENPQEKFVVPQLAKDLIDANRRFLM
jgi:predicted choloylglycine hydrolase